MTNRTTKAIEERPDRYLKDRDGIWHYQRRVIKEAAHLDDRGLIQKSLKTRSIEQARLRRDALEAADNAYWAALLASGRPAGEVAQSLYDQARNRALVLGFTYRTLDELAAAQPLEDLVARIETLADRPGSVDRASSADVKALLGGIDKPAVLVVDAMDQYIKTEGVLENQGKSEKQIKSWEKVKRRAAKNFTRICGPMAMDAIERGHAVEFFDHWRDRITGAEGLSASSGNRDLGNMRKLYREHFKCFGEEDRPNPFRNLSFSVSKQDKTKRKRMPFTAAHIAQGLLMPSAWHGINADAALIFLSLVETGCRPSEICNLVPDAIRLDHNVPHIRIDFRDDRAIKTGSSVREIPLLGVSLAAMRARPLGFPRYMDKEDSLSAALMKHFRRMDLLPSGKHSVYSIRHAFEDRMLEGGVDADLRRRILGHELEGDRPDYGQGGSLSYRVEALSGIVLPFPAELVPSIVARGG